MDLLSIGNMNRYIKNLKLQSQWTLKQQTGNYNAKGDSLEDWLDSSLRQAQEADASSGEHGDDTLRKIHQKLEAGGELTLKERDYLREHDPEAYRELINLEQEQKAYERELRRCKTQEEVERLQMTRANTSLTKIQAVEHNPHIPLSKKLKIAMTEKQRVDRVAESTQGFVSSGEFAKLPNRAEEAQANQDAVDIPSPPPEDSNRTEQETVGSETPEQTPRPETETEDKRAASDTESPEARKVRWAKAKAAYTQAPAPFKADGTETRA